MSANPDPADVIRQLWGHCRPTPLLDLPRLAQRAGVARVIAKAENERPLGNFKSLGGAVAGMRALERAVAGGARPRGNAAAPPTGQASDPLPCLLCASDGNHGLAVAAAARHAGTTAIVYLPHGTDAARAARIEALGARVRWVAGTYDDAVLEAGKASLDGEGLLVADTSADAGDPVVGDVMEGYSLLTRELAAQLESSGWDRPSHVFVQAGVGGLAAALATGLRACRREPRTFVIVEPAAAACVALALEANRPVPVEGNLHTCAEMLSCGVASAVALERLRAFEPMSLLASEEALAAAPGQLIAAGGPASTPSGAAGLAGLLEAATDPASRHRYGLDAQSVVLLIITEGVATQSGPLPGKSS